MRSDPQRWLRWALSIALLAPQPVWAQSGARGALRPPQGRQQEKNIYLRFVGRSWDDVLKSVAQQADKQVVMPEVPTGRLNRYDHAAHSLDDALRILNHELENTGYQIISKGEYLLVLKDDRFRAEYARPVVERRPAERPPREMPEAESPEHAWKQAGPRDSRTSEPQWTGGSLPADLPHAADAFAEYQEEQFDAPLLTPRSRQPIQQAGGQATLALHDPSEVESSPPGTSSGPARTGSPAQVPQSAPKPKQRQAIVVEPEHADSVEISRQLYKAYGQHARLIQEGPLGLPAFAVKLPKKDDQPAREFVVAIDQENNQLVLVAEKQEEAELLEVIEKLDAAHRRRPREATRLVVANPEVHRAATEQLPAILAQVTENQQAGERNGSGNQAADMDLADQPAQNGQAPRQPAADRPDGEEVPRDLNSILDRLRGDVSIEALNELGLLIFRGNERDVEGVMEIVRAIEQLSAGTTPEIHIRHLDNVNSEALATLLNSVYESVQNIDRRASRANRRVNIIPIVQPNSLLIIAPTQELESVLELIEELDQPLHPGQQVKIFRLKNTTSASAVALLREFYEDRGGLGTRIRVTSDARTNTLVVQASPKDLQEIAVVIRDIDKDESHAVSRLQLFPLKNAVAEEMAEFINTALEEALNPRVSTQIGVQQQQPGLNEPKSFVLEFLAGSGSQRELMRSGVLADIRVSADPRSNSLAVIAPERSMPLFAALIEALDQPSEAVAEVKVFTLTHADAGSSLTLLQQLFDQTATTTSAPVGLNLAGAMDTGSTLLPIRFSVDVRSNSILAIGGADALTVVEAILLRLDSEAPRKRKNTVLRLKNSPAIEVANAINQFLTSQRELSIIDPLLISSVEQLDREVIVVPEVVSNNLLISATPEYYAEVLRIAEELDAAPAQVIIQALLVEVQLDNLDEFGIELGFQDSVLFNRSFIDNIQTVTNTVTNQNIQTTTQQIISSEANPGFLFNNPNNPILGNNVGAPGANPSAVGAQGLGNFGLGRVNGDLGYGGLVLSASSESVSVLVRALAQQRNVQVLSRPQIRTVDSQQAQIQVGQRVPIINGVNINQLGLVNPNIEYDEAGIILSVTPRINPDGQIVMEVVAERSSYRADGVPIFTDAQTGNVISSPIKDISVARATVGVSDGQTIVLGGMISKADTGFTRKVPFLGDIPVVGRLFRYDQSTSARTELLIFLTPRVLRHDCDNELIKEIEAGRMHFFHEEAEALHGPLFSVPVGQEFLDMPFSDPSKAQFLEDELNLQTMPLPYQYEGDASGRQSLVPLSPPSLPDEDNIPRTVVPDGSLKPMSHQVPDKSGGDNVPRTGNPAAPENAKSKQRSRTSRVFR